jgi:putative ABC transport system permease protein
VLETKLETITETRALSKSPVREENRAKDVSFSQRMESFLQDLRYGARVLYSKPAFALIAIATLALGIGANTAIFSVVNAAILTPIPVPQPERVVMVWTDKVNHDSGNFPVSVPDFLDWQAIGVFDKLAGFATDGYNLLIGNRPERVSGVAVTKEWFEILQLQPPLGRVFRQEDTQPGHNRTVILSNGLWNARFNADPAIIGRTITINSSPYTVLGVLPKRVAKLADEELYVPLILDSSSSRGLRFFNAVGRLAPAFSVASAQGTLNGLNARLQKQYPLESGPFQPRLQLMEEAYVEDVHTLVLVLFGAVAFVLLIACANIANLLLVRGTTRQREIAIRAALGAGKVRLIRQLLTESVLLAVLGALAGIGPALLGIRFLMKFKPDALPNADLITLNPKVLLFTLILAVSTGLLFGAIPAWDAWRSNSASPLRERSQASGRQLRFGNLFVIAEVAFTVVLVAGALLMLRSFIQLRSTYPGYDSRVLTMRVSLTGKEFDAPEKQILFYKELLRRVAALPGIVNVGAIDCLPTCIDTQGGVLHFTDRPEPRVNDLTPVIVGSVTPDYFRAMHIPLIRGRLFSDSDGEHDPSTIILDEATAHRYWPNQDPIARSVKLRMRFPPRRIVGIVGNIERHLAVKMKSPVGQVYVPAAQSPFPEMSLAISSSMPTASLIPAVRREISAFAPDLPVFQIQTMGEARAARQMSSQFGTWLLGFFGVLSLLLAAVGVYGVTSYTVQQRTREIGVRMAIGATPSDLLFGVLNKGLLLTLIGLAAGLIGALLLTTLMKDLLHGVSSTDPMSLAGTMLVLALVGVLATFIPACRASRVPPSVALRHE